MMSTTSANQSSSPTRPLKPAPKTKEQQACYYGVKKQVYFCYGHRLMDYAGPCKNLHGHNAKVEIELSSDRLDGRGMVVDFVDIGRTVKSWLDQAFDHKMLLRKDDPLIPVLRSRGEPFVITEENPTAEHLAKLIFDYAERQGLPVESVTLWETEQACATYRKEARASKEAERQEAERRGRRHETRDKGKSSLKIKRMNEAQQIQINQGPSASGHFKNLTKPKVA